MEILEDTMKRTGKALALIFLLCCLSNLVVFATQGKINEVQEGIKDLEQQKKEAENQANSLSGKAGSLEGDLKEFNSSLEDAAARLNETEEQLTSTRNSLEETRIALEGARIREQEQYEAMKKRIRFMYEMDMEGMVEVLLSAENFADFLNKGEYIVNIHNYDRKMLEEYRATKEEIAGKEQELESQEQQLAELQLQQEEKKQELAVLVDSTSEKLSAARKQLAEAQADVKAYEAEIERQKAYEEELEAQKAAEDAKRLAEIRKQEEEIKKQEEVKQNQNSSTGSGTVTPSSDASDISLLAALIQCEAGGESYEGKLAVGSVVMNRVRSSYFPNTVAGVIYQGGQFSPVASGRFASVLAKGANQSCTQAAGEVLGGNITISCLYFRRNDGTIPGTVIGNHVFY
ncbi:cell wall hydrolase [Petralouisia muris]|jgi:peptidoglycan hydrolase CwlO-like protein|uniref:Cell wall hydrolase n=1 Tax=Petralouisia muris TaxID=3032872 RepID=A0AC61S2D9_9FIRM|nr:cell wall hydrolase [Petralouisia muris]